MLVQPDVHGRGVIHVAGIVQLLCEFLARAEAAAEVQQLHQIHDRLSPIEFLFFLRGEICQHGLHVSYASKFSLGQILRGRFLVTKITS
jgi:hypothetical protein